MCVYIYIYIHIARLADVVRGPAELAPVVRVGAIGFVAHPMIHMCIHVYIYIYSCREREKDI